MFKILIVFVLPWWNSISTWPDQKITVKDDYHFIKRLKYQKKTCLTWKNVSKYIQFCFKIFILHAHKMRFKDQNIVVSVIC